MADVKIASLTAKTTWADTDLIIVEDGADTKKMTVATLKSLLFAIPSCRTYPTSDQSIPNSVPTVVNFEGELFDTASIHDPAYPANLTAPVAGIYLLTSVVKFASNSTGVRKISMVLNGSAEIASSASQAGTDSAVSISTIYQLAANDVVQVYAFQTSGGALNTDGSGVGMSFSMTKIG